MHVTGMPNSPSLWVTARLRRTTDATDRETGRPRSRRVDGDREPMHGNGCGTSAGEQPGQVRGVLDQAGAGHTEREQALAWLDTERANLVAAVVAAADIGRDRVAVDLA